MVQLFLLVLAALLSSCSTPTYPQHELASERLHPKAGYDGKLVNEACLEHDGKVCKNWSVKAYDLTDAKVRLELSQLSFVCKLGGKHYKICQDSPAFCRQTNECNWIQSAFGCKVNVEQVPLEPYQFLIDGSLICFSQSVYSWDDFN